MEIFILPNVINNQMKKKNILFIITLATMIFLFSACTESTPKETACTMDAMICPDGTSVGRVGPDCEFEKCPDLPVDDGTLVKGCTEEAKICPDGSAVGRIPPNCEFAPCDPRYIGPPETNNKNEGEIEEKHYCPDSSRGAEICTFDYTPVCGWFNEDIQCVKFPCAQTYGNSCGACSNEDVEYYTEGECPTDMIEE